MANRTIQTVKKTIKKSIENGDDLDLALLILVNTPIYHDMNPSEILMSRNLRDNFIVNESILNPKVVNGNIVNHKINKEQFNSKFYYDKKSKNLSELKLFENVRYHILNL